MTTGRTRRVQSCVEYLLDRNKSLFPLSDESPRKITPVVTWSIIAACIFIFLWQISLGTKAGEEAIYQYGMIPARLFSMVKLHSHIAAIPAWATVVTSMFMHGGWLHLGLNMLFLWIFGANVEGSMGHPRFLIFYVACGLIAAMTEAMMNPGSTLPMVGASGAISGVLGAYFLLHPWPTYGSYSFWDLSLLSRICRH